MKKKRKEPKKENDSGEAAQDEKGQKASAFCSLLSFAFVSVSALDVRQDFRNEIVWKLNDPFGNFPDLSPEVELQYVPLGNASGRFGDIDCAVIIITAYKEAATAFAPLNCDSASVRCTDYFDFDIIVSA